MSTSSTQYNVYQQLTSARVVDTLNLPGLYINGPLNNGVGATLTALSVGVLTIDGVVVNVNDRVLLVNQTNENENGIYVATNAGGVSGLWVLTRSSDQQCIEQLKAGQFLSVNAGDFTDGSMYVLVEPLPAAMGIDPLLFEATNISNVIARLTQNIGGAGAGPLSVSFNGINPSSVVVATVESSSNVCAVAKLTPGTNIFTVTLTADPGANCFLNAIAFINGA